MPQLTAAQQQVRVEFLQQVKDGRLDLSVAESSGLPNIAYTSADFFALEQHTVFRKNWVFAGFVHQLDRIGEMIPVEVAGQPIVLVMAEDGKIRAFHNVCQHRGAKAEKYAQARDLIINNWTDLNHEDIGIIERMQRGRASDGFDGGVLSPYWDPVQRHFARLITRAISS